MTAIQIKLAEFFLAVLLLTGCYFGVRHVAVEDYKVTQIALQAEADKLKQDKYDKLAADYEAAKANREVVFKTVTKRVDRIVEKPIYLENCIEIEG